MNDLCDILIEMYPLLMSSDKGMMMYCIIFLDLLLGHFRTQIAIQSVSQDYTLIQIHVFIIRIQVQHPFYFVKSM